MDDDDDVVALVGVLSEFGGDSVDVGVEIGSREGRRLRALHRRQGDRYAGVSCFFQDAGGRSEGCGSVPRTGHEEEDRFL